MKLHALNYLHHVSFSGAICCIMFLDENNLDQAMSMPPVSIRNFMLISVFGLSPVMQPSYEKYVNLEFAAYSFFLSCIFSVYSVCPSFCLLANKRVAYRNRRCKKTPKNSTIPPSHVCVFLSYRRSNYHYSISLSGQAVRSTHNRQDQRLRMNPKRLTLKPREIWSMAAASPYNSWRNRSIDVCTVPHQVAYWNNAGGDVIYDV